MPELPEVETVKRELLNIKNKVLDKPIIYYANCIKTPIDEYENGLVNNWVIDIDRYGKFLIIKLSNNTKILFHLRMEGKLFVVDKNNHSIKHLSLFIPFLNSNDGLAFYDTRKFGVTYLLKNEDKGPLAKLGKEPFEIENASYLYSKYHKSNKYLKELLLNQEIMCGLGNIYADEVLFSSSLSPFMKGKDVTLKQCDDILENSKKILNEAILNKGSTIRTYKASQHVKGSFQSFLKVYSRENQKCLKCNSYFIKKRKLDGRGTSYCSKCQHTGYSICITGKIASGKSEVLKMLKERNFVIFSADDEIKNMYQDASFLKVLKNKFSLIFDNNKLNKEKIFKLLFSDDKFNREYLSCINSELKKRINEFIIKNDGVKKAFEVPRVFDAKMEKMFDFIIGVESINQEKHLIKREKNNNRLSFNKLNAYDSNIDKIDYIIHNDFELKSLEEEVDKMILFIDEK